MMSNGIPQNVFELNNWFEQMQSKFESNSIQSFYEYKF